MTTEAPALMELSPSDSLWLNMDTPENLMVIESVMWFDHRLDFDAVRDTLEERLVGLYPVFRWKPRFSSTVGARDEWIDDPDFDIANHLSEHELGGNGGRVELQQFLEARFSEPIPHDKPLWQAYVLGGNDFGALMIRFHHALADGTALARVLIEMTSDTPGESLAARIEDRVHPADAEPAAEETPTERDARRKRERTMLTASRLGTLGLAAGLKATSGATKLVEMLDLDREGSMVNTIANQTKGVADTLDKLLVGSRPDVAVFGRVGVAKRADWAPAHDLARVKKAAKTHDSTVNDLMLAGVAGGIRRYLATRGETGKDLMTMIPVNLRKVDEPLPEFLGNRFALVAFILPVEEEGAGDRLDEVHRRMEVIKNGPEVLITFGVANTLARVGNFSASLSKGVQEFFADKAVGVTTNVPGPQHPRYLAGQELVGILGWVPGASQNAIGVCIFSYNGQIRVGFKTDVNVVPDIANLVAAYNAEMEELLAFAD